MNHWSLCMESLTVKTKSSSLDGLNLILTARLTQKAALVADLALALALALAQAAAQAQVLAVDLVQVADQALAVVQVQVQAVDLVQVADLALVAAQAVDLALAVVAVAPVPVVQLIIGAHTFISFSKMLSGLNLILMSMLSCSNQEAMLAITTTTLLLRSLLTTVRTSDSNQKPRKQLKNLTLDFTWDLLLSWEF